MNDSLLDENLRQIRDSVLKLCAGFGDAYWLEHDRTAEFPETFYRAIADAGWLGIAMPEQYGGAGLGIVEAAVLMQAIAESGAAMSGASAVHMNIFGLQPVVVFGSDEQKQRMLPPLLQGREKACFAVTEPDAGLNTTQIKTMAKREGDRYVVSGSKIWTSTAQVADKVLLLARTRYCQRAIFPIFAQLKRHFIANISHSAYLISAAEYDLTFLAPPDRSACYALPPPLF